ncbi:PadR family transcriptional regulator [Enterococcus sp. AZ072]|uniref:PadR family transcriptional regulator n=2 Tax=unclassified Enterococcus TaxID=2608891 RepID=UPI003D277B37
MCDVQYNDYEEVMSMPEKDLVQSYITEMKRGSLVLAVLGSFKSPYYGYALLQELQDKGIEIEANTLYPLLRRLEKQGLLTSDWDTTESRPRKYYTLNQQGVKISRELLKEWKRMQESIAQIYLGE